MFESPHRPFHTHEIDHLVVYRVDGGPAGVQGVVLGIEKIKVPAIDHRDPWVERR
jgi:hypothetical protein